MVKTTDLVAAMRCSSQAPTFPHPARCAPIVWSSSSCLMERNIRAATVIEWGWTPPTGCRSWWSAAPGTPRRSRCCGRR